MSRNLGAAPGFASRDPKKLKRELLGKHSDPQMFPKNLPVRRTAGRICCAHFFHLQRHGAGFTRAVASDRLKVKSNGVIRMERGAWSGSG
jgi:hypothetical protein